MNFIKKLLFLLLLAPCLTHGQVISTVAGCGIASYAGDGGAATAAYLFHPRDVAIDKHGNVYFSEISNRIVRKIDTAGIITTIAGTGIYGYNGDSILAVSAQLWDPIGITLDSKGNLFIADAGNNRIRKVDTAGIITTIAGTGIFGYNGDSIAATVAQLNFPIDVAVDSSDNIYIADGSNYRIRKIDNSGIITTVAGIGVPGFSGDGGVASSARLGALGVVLDKGNNIYFIDISNRIRKVTASTGTITTVAGNGSSVYSGDGGAATAAGIPWLEEGIAVDSTGNVYIAETSAESSIRKINTSGIIDRIAGVAPGGFSGDGGNPLLAKLNSPTGIAIDLKGKIYIADQGNNRIRCIGCNVPTKIPNITADETPEMSITPNPTSSSCNINLNSVLNEGILYKIYDALGRLVRQASAVTNVPLTIELNSPLGVYYVQAITSSGILTEKIIIQ